MWRIVVILLALATLLVGAARMAAGDGHISGGMHHAGLSDEAAGPDCLSPAVAYEDCEGPACCMALHCAPCAIPAGPDVAVRLLGEPGSLVQLDLGIFRTGRVVAPPTAPPKSA